MGGQKDILICVAGSTPQIITETIYALSKKDPPVHPEELYIITTSTGMEIIKEALLERGLLSGLLKEYDLPEISFDESSFVVVRDRNGNPLEDIRDEEDNEAMGDLITSFIREKTSDPKVRLHCSLYPPKIPKEIECRLPDGSKRVLSTSLAEVTLADLPIIRLRESIDLGGRGFRELVAEGQKAIDVALVHPFLEVDLKERTLRLGSHTVYLYPMLLAFYMIFVGQKLSRCLHPEMPYCRECTDCFIPMVHMIGMECLETVASWYGRVFGEETGKGEEFRRRYERKGGIPEDVIRQNISKIGRELKNQLPDEALRSFYTITGVGKYGTTRYGLRVEKGRIRVRE